MPALPSDPGAAAVSAAMSRGAGYDFSLRRVPPGYPVGFIYAPETFNDAKEMQSCSISDCPYKPAYEIYHGDWLTDMPTPEGLTKGWWYVCRGHKKWLVANYHQPSGPGVGARCASVRGG